MKSYFDGGVTKYVKECKPLYSPTPRNWFIKGGSIEISIDEFRSIWKYTNSSGVSVSYIDGYIRFDENSLHPTIPEIDIGEFSGNRATDISLMLDILEEQYVLTDVPDGYVVHHDVNNRILQLVREDIHREFTHIGGHSMYGGD